MDILKFIDIYSQTISFNIDNNNKFRQNFGGFLSLVLASIFITLFILFGLDCFQRINPAIILQNLTLKEQQKYRLNPNNFGLKIKFINISNKSIPLDYFNFSCRISDTERIYSNNSRFIRIDKNDSESSFTINLIEEVFAYGSYQDKNNSFFMCSLGVCQNSTICDQTKINEYFSSTVYAVLFFNKSTVDISNTNSPLAQFEDYQGIEVVPNINKNLFLNYKNISVYNDVDLLFQNADFQTNINIDSILNDVGRNGANQPSFLSILLIFGRNIEIYRINYQKLQSVFANVGGIVTIFNIILSIIASIYGKITLNNYIVNSIYIYQKNIEEGSKLKKPLKIKNEVIKFEKITEIKGKENKNKLIAKQNKYPYFNYNQLELNHGFILYLKELIFPCFIRESENANIKLFDEVLNILNKKLEVEEYFKLHERLVAILRQLYRGNTNKLVAFEKLFENKINFFYSSYLNIKSERFSNLNLNQFKKISSDFQKQNSKKLIINE